MTGDVDNIVKPILDGLVAVAYLDDAQVERATVQKIEPGVDHVFLDLSEQFLAAVGADPPVVYVRIDADLGWRVVQ